MYPMTDDKLDVALQRFSAMVFRRNPLAIVELRYGFTDDQRFIVVTTGYLSQTFNINLITGEWVRYG